VALDRYKKMLYLLKHFIGLRGAMRSVPADDFLPEARDEFLN
jgi:hypothetical protein